MVSAPGKQLVWLATGASTGLGLALVKRILARGDCVIATARTPSKFDGLLQGAPTDRIHTMALDVTAPFETIQQSMEAAVKRFGRVDVLVNNAGTSDEIGPGEEIGVDTFRNVLNANLYGVVNCTNAILPHMRARKEGTIIIIGSRSAYRAEVPGLTAYSASKAAVHAYGETLAVEVKPMNIRVSIVVPGTFRTAFNRPNIVSPKFPEYAYFHDSIKNVIPKMNDNPLAGDPDKGMDIIVDVVRGEGRAAGRDGWPLWLTLGDDALADVKKRLKDLERSMDTWGDLGTNLSVEPKP
ncbi:NAD(P)-binding protein [Peniophora sp. CONT]|nr:NAD(P)-binding protein [Peniophora sp. CONT]